MVKQSKPIHLTVIMCSYYCRAACDTYINVEPIESVIKIRPYDKSPKGTFDPTKVTCKRCLKHPFYKEAMDKINYPLLFWRENTT